MEASSIPALFYRSAQPVPSARLRRCSDDQLVERFRAGRDEAFRVIHDRYRVRLLAYVREMLSARSNEDAEDVLQEVFERAARTLRSEGPPAGLRAWLYSVAHNRCIDELRRRPPAVPDLLAASRLPACDTVAVAERRAEVARLFGDLGGLPEVQRSALLMRELKGLSHAEVAAALGASVPAVKSLLVRARVGLTAAVEARDVACATVRDDLAATHDRRVKASALAARHLRECTTCRSYRAELRRTSRRLGALVPAPTFFPLAVIGRLLGGAGVHAKTPVVASGLAGGGGGAALAGAGKLFALLGAATVVTTGAVLEHDALPWNTPPAVHRTAQGAVGRTGSSASGSRIETAGSRRPARAAIPTTAVIRPTDRAASTGTRRARALNGPSAAGVPAPLPVANPIVPTAVAEPGLGTTQTAAVAAPVAAASPTTEPTADPAGPARDPASGGPATGGGTGTAAPSGSPGPVAAVVPVVTGAPKKLGQAGADVLGGAGSAAPSSSAPGAGPLAPVVSTLSGAVH